MNKHLLRARVALSMPSLLASAAQAQAWPTAKPIRLVVPFPAGGATVIQRAGIKSE